MSINMKVYGVPNEDDTITMDDIIIKFRRNEKRMENSSIDIMIKAGNMGRWSRMLKDAVLGLILMLIPVDDSSEQEFESLIDNEDDMYYNNNDDDEGEILH